MNNLQAKDLEDKDSSGDEYITYFWGDGTVSTHRIDRLFSKFHLAEDVMAAKIGNRRELQTHVETRHTWKLSLN